MKNDFLLNSELAQCLYKNYVQTLPVIDYHNHLSITDLAKNKRFDNLYELWVKPDPYKHRAMRMCGVPEYYITGNAPDEEKFAAWCEIFPKLAGNPLYQWSLMELQDILEIREIPGQETAKAIWKHAENYMSHNTISAKSILQKYQVEYLSPCTSFLDDLSVYNTDLKLYPSLRGDDILLPNKAFIMKLQELTNIPVTDLDTYLQAVTIRLKAFQSAGCRFVDHSLDDGFYYHEEDGKNENRFLQLLKKNSGNKDISSTDQEKLKSSILCRLGKLYADYDMILQLHMGARRHTSTRLRQYAGPAGGYAAIGNSINVASLTGLLDDLEQSEHGMPKVILFALNPADHGMVSALAGSYSKDNVPGLVTQGPAWWWCDHSYGIRSVLENTASYGLLSNFPGMVTDSRSFLSFVRHDYFRRILCSWLAERIMAQDFQKAPEISEQLIYDMCYGNAKQMTLERR